MLLENGFTKRKRKRKTFLSLSSSAQPEGLFPSLFSLRPRPISSRPAYDAAQRSSSSPPLADTDMWARLVSRRPLSLAHARIELEPEQESGLPTRRALCASQATRALI